MVSFTTSPDGAEVWISGVNHGMTPLVLEMDNHRTHTVTFKKEGHQDIICVLDTSIETKWLILDVLGGVIPIIVDAANGNWKTLERNYCNANLPSLQGSNWEKDKDSFQWGDESFSVGTHTRK